MANDFYLFLLLVFVGFSNKLNKAVIHQITM